MLRVFLVWLALTASPIAYAEPTIVVLGDSLSAAYGMPADKGWVALMQTRLKEEGFPHRVINASVTGDTTDGGLTRLPDVLEREWPELVIIGLGGNDGLRAFPVKRIRDNLTDLAKTSKKSGADVLLLGIKIPGNYGPFYTREFSNIYDEVADKTDSVLVPFFMDGVALNRKFMQDDGIHPNTKAQPKLLENVWPKLLAMLDK